MGSGGQGFVGYTLVGGQDGGLRWGVYGIPLLPDVLLSPNTRYLLLVVEELSARSWFPFSCEGSCRSPNSGYLLLLVQELRTRSWFLFVYEGTGVGGWFERNFWVTCLVVDWFFPGVLFAVAHLTSFQGYCCLRVCSGAGGMLTSDPVSGTDMVYYLEGSLAWRREYLFAVMTAGVLFS
ncbi:hypothetical protein ACJJTC_016596 [Scirpophaga incertulas]